MNKYILLFIACFFSFQSDACCGCSCRCRGHRQIDVDPTRFAERY